MIELKDTEIKIQEFVTTHKVLPKHTDFQIEHFMVGKECSINSRIWQCIREINVRKDTLVALNLEYEDAKDNIELAKIKIDVINHKPTFKKNRELRELEKRKKQIIIRKQERIVRNLENNLAELEKRKHSILLECKTLLDVFNRYNPQNKVIDIDDNQNQLEYWNAKLLEEINVNAMCGQPIGTELVKSVLALPDNAQVKIQFVNLLTNHGKKSLNSTN